jgi:hypothetical protein
MFAGCAQRSKPVIFSFPAEAVFESAEGETDKKVCTEAKRAHFYTAWQFWFGVCLFISMSAVGCFISAWYSNNKAELYYKWWQEECKKSASSTDKMAQQRDNNTIEVLRTALEAAKGAARRLRDENGQVCIDLANEEVKVIRLEKEAEELRQKHMRREENLLLRQSKEVQTGSSE